MNRNVQYTPISGRRRFFIEQVKLVLTLTVTGCVLIALEGTVLSRIPLPSALLGRAAPSLGLLFTMAVGFVYGEREGGVTGLLCGWLLDAGDGGIMLLPLFCFLCGYLSGVVGRRRLARNLPSFAVFAIIGGGMEAALRIVLAGVDLHRLPPSVWIWRTPVSAWILTVLFSPLVYGLVYGERKWLVKT